MTTKELCQRHCRFGRINGQGFKGMELSNDKQKVVVVSFRGAKTNLMHWHVKLNIGKKRKMLSLIAALIFIYLIVYLKLTNLQKYSMHIYIKIARKIA